MANSSSPPEDGHGNGMDPSPHEQFVSLFVRHEAAIHSFLLTLLPTHADADDVLQDASLTMWRRFDQYQPGTSFRNWAFQIAKYKAFNYVRSVNRDRHRFSEQIMRLLAGHAQRMQDDLEDHRRVLEHCIAKLKPEERQVLARCYREGTMIRAYAKEIGRSPNSVYKQLYRIRSALMRSVRLTLSSERGV